MRRRLSIHLTAMAWGRQTLFHGVWFAAELTAHMFSLTFDFAANYYHLKDRISPKINHFVTGRREKYDLDANY